MTHEELLERISDYVDSDCDCPKCERQYAPFRGLYAVVELHKPDEYCCPVCGPALDVCGVEYPCPTIQAIEEKMG